MKEIRPNVEFVLPPSYDTVLMTFNTAARNCYKSETSENSNIEEAEKLARRLIAIGHGSPIEMNNITVKIITDRSFLAQVTRHRLASFAVTSQRYCNYSKDKFGHNIDFICPRGITYSKDKVKHDLWQKSCLRAEKDYFDLIDAGCKPEEARSVLPNSASTEIVMGTNIREWRHIFELRCDSHAQIDIREIMTTLLNIMYVKYPVFFEDLYEKFIKKSVK